MSKNESKLKPTYSANLEELIKEQNIKKKELAELIHTTPQTISKACNGVRLTRPMAESIVENYPQYNVAWLLGLSDFKLKEDIETFQHQQEEEFKQRGEYLLDSIEYFEERLPDYIADLLGYRIDVSGDKITDKVFSFKSKQGKELPEVEFDSGEMDLFVREVLDYGEFVLQRMINRKHSDKVFKRAYKNYMAAFDEGEGR